MKQIGTLGTIDTITLGARVLTDLSNLIVLYGSVALTSDYTTLRLPNATSGYQVTGGKTFKIVGLQTMILVPGSSGSGVAVLYGDTDVGLNSGSAPTNPIFPTGLTAVNVISPITGDPAAGSAVYSQSFDFNVPAGKYLSIFLPSGNVQVTVAVYGYEV